MFYCQRWIRTVVRQTITKPLGLRGNSKQHIKKRKNSLNVKKRWILESGCKEWPLSENIHALVGTTHQRRLSRRDRPQRYQQLLQRFPSERSVRIVWFTHEKRFTMTTPVNAQNDCVYSTEAHKKDNNVTSPIRQREHFSRSIMKKSVPDLTKVNKYMSLTFALRRKEVT